MLGLKMKITHWKELIPGCFAWMEAPFGVDANDKERAIRMLHLALCQGAKMDGIIKESKNYLKSKGLGKETILFQVDLINKFKPNPIKPEIKKTKAWLVTWEGTKFISNDQSNKIVNIFDSRTPTQRIKDFIEDHYMACHYSLFERATYSSNRKRNPYPAESGRINGVPWSGQFTCGHNPFLVARLVNNLVVVKNEKGKEIMCWEEISKPKPRI